MTMMHPGLPEHWQWLVAGLMLLALLRVLLQARGKAAVQATMPVDRILLLGAVSRFFNASPWPLLFLKIIVGGLFLLVIAAGLFGTPIAERNLATTLTWTVWWAGIVIVIFFLGSAWCAVCPWDTLASWLVKRKLWRRADEASLGLRVPKPWRNVWPALAMFIGLTWLELGVGVTTDPYMTAVLALIMVVLATVYMAVFEGKAFCKHVCPVGRTVGFYSQLAMVELRPRSAQACADCKTLECYHGTQEIEPCPTHLVMGRLNQSTYCTACSACTMSCPHDNVGWRLRSPAVEAIQHARPHWDEAWFMLGLMALTTFHGITMMPFWEQGMSSFAQIIGDSGQLLWSFSLGMLIILFLPILLYAGLIWFMQSLLPVQIAFKQLFARLAFVSLPLAFTYHIAHNLNHLIRESRGFTEVLMNPLGRDTLPLSSYELHMRHMNPLISEQLLFGLQALLIAFGFWVALQVLKQRSLDIMNGGQVLRAHYLLPGIVFILVVTVFNLWLLAQPMVMRM
jgi:polyferredoxin